MSKYYKKARQLIDSQEAETQAEFSLILILQQFPNRESHVMTYINYLLSY